jgi:hypothetical protein
MERPAVAALALCDSLVLGLAVLALATVLSRKTGASAQTANTPTRTFSRHKALADGELIAEKPSTLSGLGFGVESMEA